MDRPYLELEGHDRSGVVPLTGDVLTVGRAPGNDLLFAGDPSVSREHAVLECRSGQWYVRDLRSTGGSWVNGQRVTAPWRLGPGDLITVGGQRLVFRPGPSGAAAVARPAAPPNAGAPPRPAPAAGYLDLGEEWAPAVRHPTVPPPGADPIAARPPLVDSPPGTEPRVPRRDTPAPEPHGSGRIRGVARGIQTRQAADKEDKLVFRVDRHDSSGNRLDPVPVEFPTYRAGQVGEGDEVEVGGRWKHGTLRADSIVNLSTGAQVRGRPAAERAAMWIVGGVVVTIFLVIMTTVLVSILVG